MKKRHNVQLRQAKNRIPSVKPEEYGISKDEH